MRKHSLYSYSWDLPGNGAIDIARLRAELDKLGVEGLTLAASYHAGKFISLRQGGRVMFPEDGTVYFMPRLERYGKLKPLVSTEVARRHDPFAALARDGRIPVDAWMVVNHNYRLGSAHPECTVRNLWGDPYLYSLCPSHPDVQRYAHALCLDVAEQGHVRAISIESSGFLTYAHGFHHEFQQVEMTPWIDAILGLCFCDHCVAGAKRQSIDAERLKERLKRALFLYLQSNATATPEMSTAWLLGDLVFDDDLRAMLRWRCDATTAQVASIRGAMPRHVELSVIATCQRPHATAFIEGMDLHRLASVADVIELPLYQPSAGQAEADAFDAVRRIGGGNARVRAILRPGPPDMTSASQLEDAVTRLTLQGVTEYAFYNYGMLRARDLRAISTIAGRKS
ncbi:hypothetical protein X994_6490 (plasmid) [Burkholderia pseudomallei]|uniref:Uncharacterized protein n=1 Tax=Burkholderia pseudomallei TaxID=28450 RepID=A0AA40JJ09_BURPE|nr:hypothetical protein [Burkholderia pseudomallei]AIV73667.1 hypothetical protein X994_6490 [Burkholderia pseudomallei]KGD54751.1 hypothetical protein DP49_5113 [Burkholderia pseudomallei]KGS74143.1 hypothetical protein X942_5522 [Burkholderia pseudomallei MSHR5596]KGW80300.1 hypothetical protein Y046_6334 [Burkholderia pseudomallei MSHR2990]KGX17198.1 hypothetical protein Y036_6128 [Burkholderia pseudomallei]